MGWALGALAGGLQGASQGLESMAQSRAQREAKQRQMILDAINQRNIDHDNSIQDETLAMHREEGGYTKAPDGHWSFDPSNTREARVAKIRDAEDAQKISAAEVAYLAAGMSPAQASAAARNPGLADNFLFPKPDQFTEFKKEHDYRVSHPLPSRAGVGGSRSPSPITGLTHAATAVKAQIGDTQREITAAGKVPPLTRHSSAADSANFNTATSNLPRLQHTKDSLQTVYGRIASKMQEEAGMPVEAAPSGAPVTPQGNSPDQTAIAARAAALYRHMLISHPQMDDGVIRGAVRKQLHIEFPGVDIQ